MNDFRQAGRIAAVVVMILLVPRDVVPTNSGPTKLQHATISLLSQGWSVDETPLPREARTQNQRLSIAKVLQPTRSHVEVTAGRAAIAELPVKVSARTSQIPFSLQKGSQSLLKGVVMRL